MARILPFDSVVQVNVWTSLSNQAAVNRIFYNVTVVGASPATDQDVADALDVTCAGLYPAVMADSAYYNGVTAQVVNPLPLMLRAFSDSHGAAGTGGALCCPKQTCGLIRLITALAGPGFRGRSYLPWIPAQRVSALGEVDATYKTAADDIADLYTTDVLISTGGRTATLKPILWRRAGNLRTNIINSFTLGKVATQRRRGDYGRPNTPPV